MTTRWTGTRRVLADANCQQRHDGRSSLPETKLIRKPTLTVLLLAAASVSPIITAANSRSSSPLAQTPAFSFSAM